jgi:RNA polymerase sigma-70 factor (ECF subfamily)
MKWSPSRGHGIIVEMAVPVAGVLVVGEAEQIALARRGDARAREQLYRAHVAHLARHVRFLVHDAAEAEDLVQETFAAAFASLWRFRGEAAFATWLHRIALNLARHHWRRCARRRAALAAYRWMTGGGEEAPGTPHGDVSADEDLHVVRRAVDSLTPKLREAFALLVLEELSGEEAARLSGAKIEVLRVRATRARQRIQQALGAAQGEES